MLRTTTAMRPAVASISPAGVAVAAPRTVISAPSSVSCEAASTSSIEVARSAPVEMRLAQLESMLGATVQHVEKQLSEVCGAVKELTQRSHEGQEARLDPDPFLGGSIVASVGSAVDVQGELNHLQKQLDSLQTVVDSDVLEAFRRLRQQMTEIGSKVDQLAADRETPPEQVVASIDHTDLRPSELTLAELHALEARISSTLLSRLDALGEEVLLGDEKMSQRVAEAEAALAEVMEKQASFVAQNLTSNRAQVSKSPTEDRAGSQELLADMDARMSEVGQELLLLMEERFAAVEEQILSHRTESAASLTAARQELIELTGHIHVTVEERMSSIDLCISKLREDSQQEPDSSMTPSKPSSLARPSPSPSPGRQSQHFEDVLESFSMNSAVAPARSRGHSGEYPSRIPSPAQTPTSAARRQLLQGELESHGRGPSNSVNTAGMSNKGKAAAMSLLRMGQSIEAKTKVIEQLEGERHSLEAPCGDSNLSASTGSRQHDGQPAATGSAAAAPTSGTNAREALVAFRGRLQAQASNSAAAAAAAAEEYTPDGAFYGCAEEAVVAAIAAARAKGSPTSDHHDVASAFSPMVADRAGSSSASPSRFHCSDIVDPEAWAASMREEGNLTKVGEPSAQSAEQRVQQLEEKTASSGQSAGSPSMPHRGRQPEGRPDPSDYQDVSVQDSPFRRRQHTRDILPRFGSPALANWAPTPAMRSVKEEDPAARSASQEVRPNLRSASAAATAALAALATVSQAPRRSESWKGGFLGATHPVSSPKAATRPRTPTRARTPPLQTRFPEAGADGQARTSPAPSRRGSPGVASRGTEAEQPNPILMERRKKASQRGSLGASASQPEMWKRGTRSPNETVTTHVSDPHIRI